jgi:hypothetical protein
MKRTYDYEKKPSQSTTPVQPTASYLQTRGFAPIQTDLDEDATFRPSGYTENFLEKLISQRSTESSNPPVQRKPHHRLNAIASQHIAIQAKLSIGEPNDKYEQEADATASKVVQQINSTPQDQSVQREAAMEEEEELQMKPISSIQRDESMEEDEELQMKSLVQRRGNLGGGEASTDLESSIQSARGSGQSLDASLQAKMGQAMGADFSSVKVHTDSQSDQLNKSIQAKAFTTGQDVFFRQGAYEPSSKNGQELLAHELTHVVQQNGGAVQRQFDRSVIQRAISKPKTSVKQLKTLTGQLEKAVRNDQSGSEPSGAIYGIDPDYYLKLFRYKFEKHKGNNKKLIGYKNSFRIQALVDAWNQRGAYSEILKLMSPVLMLMLDEADKMAIADPDSFLEYILRPMKKMSSQGSNFLTLLERPSIRNSIKTLNNGTSWLEFVSDIPQFAVSEGIHQEVENKGLVLNSEQIIDRIFDAVIHNQRIDVGYYTNNLTLDPGPTNILKNATPEEKAARLERARLDASKPSKPSLQCDNLMKVLHKVVEMYPGMNTTFAIGMEKKALLTVPLDTLGGGLIPNTFKGNVVDADGNYTNQIFFTGVTESNEPRSHTWNIIGGKPYDSVLGTKGPGVAGSIAGQFTQKKVSEDKWEKAWVQGNIMLTPITDKKAAPNSMGFDTAYQIKVIP